MNGTLYVLLIPAPPLLAHRPYQLVDMATQYSTDTHKPETLVKLARHDIPGINMEILHIYDLIWKVQMPKQVNWPV